MSSKDIWEGPDVPRPQVQLFHKRFGGGNDIEAWLEGWIRKVPQNLRFLRPLLRLLIPLAKKAILWLRLHRTLISVDLQTTNIRKQAAAAERSHRIDAAIAKAQELYPDAEIERAPMPKMATDALVITHPPREDHPAELKLGFSEMRIAAPWTIEREHQRREHQAREQPPLP